jgi:predicted  nucleic acid-binding Zn-ribbon protein
MGGDMTESGPRDVCDLLEDAIKFIKQDIAAKEARIEVLTGRLQKLQDQQDPDLAQIAEIQADIQQLETELASDRPQLSAFEEEFAAACRPS